MIHALLYFYDDLPLNRILFSVLCHVVYLQNFTPAWPSISLTSLSFLASCALVICDHFLWFIYFARVTQEARHRAHRAYRGPIPTQPAPGFVEIATFFGICVWLAPLFLFLSLSANDNTLPVNTRMCDQKCLPYLTPLTAYQFVTVCLIRLRLQRMVIPAFQHVLGGHYSKRFSIPCPAFGLVLSVTTQRDSLLHDLQDWYPPHPRFLLHHFIGCHHSQACLPLCFRPLEDPLQSM